MQTTTEDLGEIVKRYRSDPESVYNTWFIRSPERLKAFRSIRRGVMEVVKAIREESFGADFKGSPLETVLQSITEQKQVFEGAGPSVLLEAQAPYPRHLRGRGEQAGLQPTP